MVGLGKCGLPKEVIIRKLTIPFYQYIKILHIQQRERDNPTDGVLTVHASRYPNDTVEKLLFLLRCMERLDAVKLLQENAGTGCIFISCNASTAKSGLTVSRFQYLKVFMYYI